MAQSLAKTLQRPNDLLARYSGEEFVAIPLPWGIAFAAGAMLFVIVDEIIPDIDQKELGQVGTLGVMVGFVVMMFLDVTLG